MVDEFGLDDSRRISLGICISIGIRHGIGIGINLILLTGLDKDRPETESVKNIVVLSYFGSDQHRYESFCHLRPILALSLSLSLSLSRTHTHTPTHLN